MKTWAICVALILGASWAFGGAGGRSITLDINQQDRAFSNSICRAEAYDWEIYLTRGGSSYTQETFTGGGVYYSTSRTASAWVVFPFSSWSASGARVVCRMDATNSMGLSTNSADYPIAYDASIILTTANNVYRWRQGVLTITDDGAVSGSGIAAATSTMVPNSRTLTINGVTYDLSANRSWTVSTTATLPAGTVAATNQGVAGQSLFWNAGAPTGVSTGYWATASGSGDMLASVYDPGSVQRGVVFTNDQRVTLALTNGALYATAAQGIAATNAQARVAVVETNAVLRGDTNGWVVSSHAAFITAESDPVFATNGAPRSWVAGFETAPVTWDSDFLVPAVTMPDGTVGQLFEETYVTIRNTSGGTITNGTAVRATSASGFYSGAMLASCTDSFDNVLGVIGLATMTITNGGTGKITLVGNVNELDTTAFVEGSNLWLSTTAGELTMIKPTAAGCKQVRMGVCLRSNGSVGRIGVAVRIVPLPEDIGAVATSDTNAWETGSHTGLVSKADTNGWTVTTHADFVTNGQKIAAATNADYATVSGTASNLVGAQSNLLATALQPVSTQGLATVVYVDTATNAAVVDATNRVAGVGYLIPASTQGLATVAYVNAATNGIDAPFLASKGGLTNPAAFMPAFTNATAFQDGVFNGSNGVYWTRGTTNYWITFP